jgi:hypothetical protein
MRAGPQTIPLHQQTLADRERVLGPDHSHTLTSRNSLAAAYRRAVRAAEAIPLFEQTLADCVRMLGPDHHDIRLWGNLWGAVTFGGVCQFSRAIFRSRSKFARPYMSRLRYLILQFLPSRAPLL